MRIFRRVEHFRRMVKSALLVALFGLGGVALESGATTQSSSTQPTSSQAVMIQKAQPNLNPGLIAGVLSATGLTTANTIGGAVNTFSAGGGPGSFSFSGFLPGTNRFALPGQGETGTAGAPGGKAWNAWVSLSQNHVGYSFSPLQSGGTVDVGIVGVDYSFANNMILGVAVSGDRSNIDLNYIGGKLTGRGTTISPYLGIPLNKNWTVDTSIGIGRTRLTTSMLGVDGRTTDDRTVANLGVSYREIASNWMLVGRGTYLSVRDKLGSYTMSNGTFVPDGTVSVSQLRFGGQAVYNGGWVMPHVGLTYIYDLKRPNQEAVNGETPSNDRDAWQATLGLQFKSSGTLYGGIQYSTETSRSQIKNNQILFNLGARF